MALAQAATSGSAVQTALSLRGIDKSYGRTHALDHVDLELRVGEVHCLVGENGAGKSTLLKILAGAERPDAGEIVLHGERYARLAPRQAIELGIATIYQEPDLVGSLTVAENVFLGAEPVHGPVVDRRTQRRLTRALCDDLELALDPDATVDDLSPGAKQLVQIVKALRHEPRVMIMDEATSSLGPAEKDALLQRVRRLAAGGLGVLYVSHILDEVFVVGDRVTVLKDGRTVESRDCADIGVDEIVHAMVGRAESAFFAKEHVPIGEPVLVAEGYSGHGVHDVSFEVRRGEVLGFGGLVGSGRTELLEMVFGAVKPASGRLTLHGREITPRTPAQAIARGVCMLTEDRQGTGLLRERSVRENIAVARNERNGPLLRHERGVANRMIDALRIATTGGDQDVTALSGGNQQKTLLGRWLAVDGEVFILDEPTKGVDIGAKHEIYRLIGQLAARGKAVVLVSSDLPELLSLSDRIAVMRNGRLVTVVEASAASEQSLAKEYLGVASD